MTTNINFDDVMKALECCASEDINACDYCPYEYRKCVATTGDVLALIDSKNKEIEELKTENERLERKYRESAKQIGRMMGILE